MRSLLHLGCTFLFVALLFLHAIAEDDANLTSTAFVIDSKKINESSGIAVSWRHPGVLWTHNDSGDPPRLFAISCEGDLRSEVAVRGGENVDWEDMASYVDADQRPQLLIGDVGDNARRRKEVFCYRLNEPKLDNHRIKVDQTWRIKYPDGPRDCEAIAVDVRDGVILLAAKNRSFTSEIYSVPLAPGEKKATVTAKLLGSVALPMITGMDIHPRSGQVILLTYADAIVLDRRKDKHGDSDWRATLSQTPTLVRLPIRRQGESICFDRNEDAVWLTSEKLPAALIRAEVSLPARTTAVDHP